MSRTGHREASGMCCWPAALAILTTILGAWSQLHGSRLEVAHGTLLAELGQRHQRAGSRGLVTTSLCTTARCTSSRVLAEALQNPAAAASGMLHALVMFPLCAFPQGCSRSCCLMQCLLRHQACVVGQQLWRQLPVQHPGHPVQSAPPRPSPSMVSDPRRPPQSRPASP